MPDSFHWLNPPDDWSGDTTRLELRTGARTDFWRQTFYGFIRDSGHAFLRPVSGDFTASVKARGDYEALYDQTGLLLRIGETHWIKAGIEFTDGLTAQEAAQVEEVREVLDRAADAADRSVLDTFATLWRELPCSTWSRRPAWAC